MNKPIYLIILLLTACQPIQDAEVFVDDDIAVNQSLWKIDGNTKPYPFTVKYGNIACTMNEVYFYPNDTANDESQVGLPINRLAEISLRRFNMKPTMANTIKPNADLSEVINIGLDVCEKMVRSQK
jgi:hypothetical protein